VKVLWIDNEEGLRLMRGFTEILVREGFELSTFYWDNFEVSDSDIDRVVEVVRKVNVAIVHFGSIPRFKASEILTKIKKTGVKVIVKSGILAYVFKNRSFKSFSI